MEHGIYLVDIPISVKRQLCCHLDINVSGNWEALAEIFDIGTPEILQIKSTRCGSYTERILEIIRNRVSIIQLQEALKAIGNEAALKCLTDAYPDIVHRYKEAREQRCQQQFLRVVQSEDGCGRQASDASPPQVMQLPGDLAPKGICSKVVTSKRPPSILLTHASEGPSTQYFSKILEWLHANKFDAGFITEEEMFPSLTQYVEKCYREARFIVMLVTEDYLNEVTSEGDDSSSSVSLTVTRYIFQLMEIELFEKTCTNTRFIPVLIDAPRKRLPMHFRNTIVYQWPDHYERLHGFLTERIGPSSS